MPEHIRALCYILVLATGAFAIAKRPLCRELMTEADFKRRRNVWFAVTLVAFLAHNFWVCALAVGVIAGITAGRDRTPLAVYAILLCAMPPFQMPVAGLGLINKLFDLNHYRLLSLVILLPIAVRIYRERSSRTPVPWAADGLVKGYVLLVGMVYSLNLDTATSAMRAIFHLILDLWLPYYVFSRGMRSKEDFYQVGAGFVLGMTVLAPLAMFESVRHWLLYDSLRVALGVPQPEFAAYLGRGVDGPLRALVTTEQPIVLGYVMMIAIALVTFIGPRIQPASIRLAGTMLLIGGLIAPFSRGPWVGAVVVAATAFCLDPAIGKKIARATALLSVATVVLFITPLGKIVLHYLPFVGDVESENIDYRERLFEVSLEVWRQNPWWGDFWFLRNPLMEQMRQGQGIIDVVNTYVQVALPFGLIGLMLFVFPFGIALRGTWAVRRECVEDIECERLGRALIAAVMGALVTIATVSSIAVIPVLYWILLGLCCSYIRLFGAKRIPSVAQSRRGRMTRTASSARAV